MWSPLPHASPPPGPWIHSRRWDLLFLFASVVLVAVPLASYHLVARATGVPPQAFQHGPALGIAMLINLGAAFLIGGPHVYATFTYTLAERRFRQRHPLLLFGAALIPALVIALVVLRIELLMTLFFAWAGVHVLHQVVYIVEQYQRRARAPVPAWSRSLDFVLVFASLYPLASWRLLAPPGAVLELPFGLRVNAGFSIGKVDLARELPAFLQGQTWLAALVGALFAAALALFLARTAVEVARGRCVWPRTLFLALTVPVAFALPLFDNLDVALQGFNLWHSTQYLGLVYLINSIREAKGEISSPWVSRLSGPDRALSYYAFVVAVATAAGGVIGVLHYGFGLPLLQAYYGVLLSGLWVHYLWDHAVFLEPDALTPISAAPVQA